MSKQSSNCEEGAASSHLTIRLSSNCSHHSPQQINTGLRQLYPVHGQINCCTGRAQHTPSCVAAGYGKRGCMWHVILPASAWSRCRPRVPFCTAVWGCRAPGCIIHGAGGEASMARQCHAQRVIDRSRTLSAGSVRPLHGRQLGLQRRTVAEARGGPDPVVWASCRTLPCARLGPPPNSPSARGIGILSPCASASRLSVGSRAGAKPRIGSQWERSAALSPCCRDARAE